MALTRPLAATAGLTTEQVIASGACQMGLSEQDFVDEAVRAYLAAYCAEPTARMRQVMSKLDGTDRAGVALLTGVPPERVDELGGTGE